MTMQIGIEVEVGVFKLRTPVVCDFLPYTKEKPHIERGNAYHKDASFLELAMKPCKSGRQLDSVWKAAIARAGKMLPDGASFGYVPAATYSDEELAKDEYASVLGCSPSLNLYANGEVRMPDQYPDNTRYAGMHVNISDDERDLSEVDVLKLDAILGLTSVRDWEQEFKAQIQQRRTVYGRAGEYRLPPFGIEYRTLPVSSWPKTTGKELFALVTQALDLEADKVIPLAMPIREAIDTCNAGMADDLLKAVA